MIKDPINVLSLYPIRKTRQQKDGFLNAVTKYAKEIGYTTTIEEGKRGVRNVVMGDPDGAKYLITAHYDTPASIGLPNLIAPNNPFVFFLLQFVMVGALIFLSVAVGFLAYWLGATERVSFAVGYLLYMVLLFLMLRGPANQNNANDNTSGVVTVLEVLSTIPKQFRDRVCFVLFDMEEAWASGICGYQNNKNATENQIVLNLDCVGDGDVIQITPVNNARKDQTLLENLSLVCRKSGQKELRLRSEGFYKGSSDHKKFPKGVAIMAFRYCKGIGLYCSRIHTWRDKILDMENVKILCDALISIVSNDNVK